MEDITRQVLEPDNKILGTEITIEEIKSRIAKLAGYPKDNLKEEMGKLKIALRLNPEAANLLLPEEIGELTKAIYRMTEQVVIQSAAKSTAKTAKKIDLSKLDKLPDDF